MKLYLNPPKEKWGKLIGRALSDDTMVVESVRESLKVVKEQGESGLKDLIAKYDKVERDSLFASEEEIERQALLVGDQLKEAIEIAISNITKFHSAQQVEWPLVESFPGVRCWVKNLPITKVGLYVPGGSAPLFSTLLMLAIPAQLAGCSDILIATPADSNGTLNCAIAYCAKRLNLNSILLAGGAQAIGAMAYGTETILARDKIFGPGNRFVTKAKELVSGVVAVDMPAGPSELMVIADSGSNPNFVAADLLSQAEHGADSQLFLLSNSLSIIEQTMKVVDRERQTLPRGGEIEGALKNSSAILLPTILESIEFANLYAPEHLILSIEEPWSVIDRIEAAGSVFVGGYSPVSAGDYLSGTNHTLPTSGWARSLGGITLESFKRKISFQELTPDAIVKLNGAISTMALEEGLVAHARAVEVRVDEIINKN
ncbi:MAG: histidinol dehydrogenase [Bacteroidales bacterium]